MHDILICLFLLNVLLAITGAAAATVSSATFFGPLIPTYPQTRPSATVILTSTLNPVRNHPREFTQTSNESQSGTTAPFPTYAIGLLALFIVLCALSSALVTTIIYSNTARIWIGSVTSRVCTSTTVATARLTARWTVEKDLTRVEEHEKKDEEVAVLNISPANSIPSFHADVAHKVKSESTTASRKNLATTTPMSRPAAKLSNCSYENMTGSPQRSLTTSLCKHPSAPTSPSSDHLQTLVLASTGLLMNLTADMQSRCLSRLSPRSAREVAGDDPVTVVSTPSSSSIKSGGFTSTEVAVNPVPSRQISSMKGETTSRSAANITIQRSPVFTIKHSIVHSSPSHSSSSTFYSLSDDTHLSPSIAFQSLVDLTTLGESCGIDSDSARARQESPLDDNLGNSLASPRYVHGMQLETIDEENEEQIPPIPLTIPDTQSNTEVPTCPGKTGRASSLNLVPHERLAATALDVISPVPTQCTLDHGLEIILEDIARNTYSAASPGTKHMPCTPDGRPQSPGLPRFAPAARSAPLPSEPKSGIAHVSALRSPERSPRCNSVAWLSPVIEWAVDDPGEGRDYGVAPESPRRQELLVNAKGDEECEDALHAADAVAAVMDSLAAIGLDPTAMGLMTGEPTFHTLPDAGVRTVSPPTSFANSMTSSQSRHAQAAADNLVEEEEVEKEVGIEPRGPACRIPSSNSLRSQCPENTRLILIGGQLANTQSYVPSLRHKPISEEQLHGEEVETAQFFRHSSSLHTDPGGTEAKDIEWQIKHPEASGGTAAQKTSAVQLVQRENAKIHHKQVQMISAVVEDLGGSKTSRATGRVRSPSVGQSPRTSRGQPDRLYPSPSSLAGLSHVEVAKKFSSQSPSPAVSTPSPRGKHPSPPPARSPPVSPLQLRKAKGTSLSPIFGNTPSTLTSSPRNDTASPSPRSRSPMFLPQQPEHMSTPVSSSSSFGSSHSTPMLFPRRKPRGNSSVSHSQRQKSTANPQLGGSTLVLQERTNSMEFRVG